jgi:YggT family protein
MTSLLQIVLMLIHLAKWIVLAHVIMSWLINFNVLNLSQPLVWQIWNGLNRILEPVYTRVRRFVPGMGGIDFAPLIVLVAILALEIVVSNNLYAFG